MAPTSSNRRGFLAALALSGGAAVPVGLAMVAPSPPADAVLIRTGERWAEACAAHLEAEASVAEASRAHRDVMGWCPPEIRLDRYDDELLRLLRDTRDASGLRIAPGWDYFEEFGPDSWMDRWDGACLRAALDWLPRLRGHAGRTPFLKRTLRPLLPIAEARDAVDGRWRAHYRLDELQAAARVARKSQDAIEREIIALPAATLAGVVVKARLAQSFLTRWREHSPSYRPPEALEAVMVAALSAAEPAGATS